MDCSMPGFPDRHQLLELAQTHVHRVGDGIQPSRPLSWTLLGIYSSTSSNSSNSMETFLARSLCQKWTEWTVQESSLGIANSLWNTKRVYVKLFQSYLTLCNPMDCSLPGSSVCGILQAKILEWVAMPFSRGFSLPRDQTYISYVPCIGRQVFFLIISATHKAVVRIKQGNSWKSSAEPGSSVNSQ